jgi:hypothetical protein
LVRLSNVLPPIYPFLKISYCLVEGFGVDDGEGAIGEVFLDFGRVAFFGVVLDVGPSGAFLLGSRGWRRSGV